MSAMDESVDPAPPPAYAALEARFRRVGVVGECASFLHWDTRVMMPAGAAAGRGEQLAVLDVLTHEALAAPETAELLDRAETEEAASLDDWQRANLREMRRHWVHAAAVPADLVEASSRAESACQAVWADARAKDDFAAVRPPLEEVVRLTRESAAARAERLGVTPYEALLDRFEPGGRVAWIDRLFAPLADALPGLVEEAVAAQASGPVPAMPRGPFPVNRQRVLAERLMTALGIGSEHGRLDVSEHPFSAGTPDDTRVTTRYNTDDFTESLLGVLHEVGHALYERGRPAAWRWQPVGQARGMSVHESQSLIIEMQACRSRPFLEYAAPLMRQAFGGSGPAWEPGNLHRLYLRVERGLIRVDADEVTYPLHVILRYRLETALIAGDLAVADLPAAWNDGMATLLGVTPPDDRRGVLQDIHWYSGAFGYFPTYTIGALAAAQLHDAALRARPDIPEHIAAGDFEPLIGWLRDTIHSRGSLLETPALIEEASGAPLDPAVFLRHLRTRYLDG